MSDAHYVKFGRIKVSIEANSLYIIKEHYLSKKGSLSEKDQMALLSIINLKFYKVSNAIAQLDSLMLSTGTTPSEKIYDRSKARISKIDTFLNDEIGKDFISEAELEGLV